jgi:hypothetical protein
MERDWEEAARKRLERSFASVVIRLRALADRVEAEVEHGLKAVEKDRSRSYVRIIGTVVHEITWGLANLNLSTLTDAAQDAQEAREQKRWDAQEARVQKSLDTEAGEQ